MDNTTSNQKILIDNILKGWGVSNDETNELLLTNKSK